MKNPLKQKFQDTFNAFQFLSCIHLKPSTEHSQEDRKLWLWTQGFTHIILIQQFRTDKFSHKLKSILETTDTNPESYHFNLLSSPNAVYLKSPCSTQTGTNTLPPLFPSIKQLHTYFGSTIVNMLLREANRTSKFRQLLNGTPTKCELALRWWYHHLNYHWFPTIVISLQFTATKSRAMEHAFIAHYSSTLNYPFIGKYVIQTTTGFKSTITVKQFQYSLNYIRWLNKARSRHFHKLPILTTIQYYQILFGLAANTRESWDTQRALRSKCYTNDELYLLWRLHKTIENPHQSIITGHLRTTFQFRQLTEPKHNVALKLPPLCHSDFFKTAGKILRSHIKYHKSIFCPFHIPTHEISGNVKSQNPRPSVQLQILGLQILLRASFPMPMQGISPTAPPSTHGRRPHRSPQVHLHTR